MLGEDPFGRGQQSRAIFGASRLRRDGVEAELVITEGAPHIWQHFGSFLPEARESLARIGRHISAHISD